MEERLNSPEFGQLDLVIVGAQKAGTTSLLNYLKDHPQVNAHLGNEFSYFADPKQFEKGYATAFDTYFSKKPMAIRNIAKNVTICSDKNALERLKKEFPDTKLVFILREPTNRAYSGYTMGVSQGWMNTPFSEIANDLEQGNNESKLYSLFISLGLYANQLETIFSYFDPSKVRIILFEEFKDNPTTMSNNVCRWLGIDPIESGNSLSAHNVTTRSKSTRIASLLDNLKKESNPLKRIVRNLLPYSFYFKLTNGLQSLNETEAKFEPMTSKDREILNQYYEPENNKLKHLLQQPRFSDSIQWIGKGNWLFNSNN